MNQLKKRILDISYKHGLSHLGSCLTAVDIIDEIYRKKKPEEKFVLSAGHAGLALYCVVEKYEGIDAEKIWKHHGTHPDRCAECHIDCSTGSLGQGLPIAIGMALADRSKNVYCLVSDGECAEGIIWESLRIKRHNFINNLFVYVNFNGWGAYDKTYADLSEELEEKECIVRYANINNFPKWMQGQAGHYHVMKKDERIWLLVGDLGYKVFDQIRDDFPDRFLNTGAAEQAMMGIACGLALEGKKPFVYSIATFLLYRPFETIRNYINHEKIPVRLVASGRDKDYEHDGFSHWSEDAKKTLDLFGNIRQYWPDKKEEIPDIVKEMVIIDEPSFVSLKR